MNEEQAERKQAREELRGPPARLPMMRSVKEKISQSYGVIESAKSRKAAKLHVTVWPEGAGDPFPVDVEPDDEGAFYLDKQKEVGPYRIRPGTVVHEGGKYRAWIKEGHYETLDPRDLGKGPHPRQMNGLMEAGIISEIESLAKRRWSAWQKAGVFGFGLLALMFVGVMVWATISLGGDLDGIRNALDGLPRGNGPPPPQGPDSGHQPIAPGGG